MQLLVLAALEGANAFEVAEITRAVDPLIGTWQRRQGLGGFERLAGYSPCIELGGKRGKGRRVGIPVVQGGLQGGRDAGGGDEAGAVGREDDELAIGTAVAEGG
ncbi:hypothetical protein D3C72_2188240 [compost metagenome]